MYIKLENSGKGNAGGVVIQCPICGNNGTFFKVTEDIIVHVTGNHYWLGHRVCPNDKCHAHVFFTKDSTGKIIVSPPLRINFNSENIPEKIRKTLTEAISCFAEECPVASAIMVRRTLEEICADKGCEGDNLKKKIENLKSKVVLPSDLFVAMDELRLLGNDAAHIESKDYEKIGKEEVAVAIELAKEILKAVYQLDSLVKRLKGLKRPS